MIEVKNFPPKKNHIVKTAICCFFSAFLLLVGCSKDDETVPASLTLSTPISQLSFPDTMHGENSSSKSIRLNYAHLNNVLTITPSTNFEVSIDDTNFQHSLQLTDTDLTTNSIQVYIRFSPTLDLITEVAGNLIISSENTNNIEIKLTGTSTPTAFNYITFNSERLAFGDDYKQSSFKNFTVHKDLSEIKTIKMYVKLTCPNGGCDEWDVYGNVLIKDTATGDWYELGRFITPYWNDNSQLDRGFEFDVTDFKSLLTDQVELKIFTECWNNKGYNVTVDFDYIKGTPSFTYSSITKIIQYNKSSGHGVPYGLSHNFDLTKSITIPSNAEYTSLRSIISGWGHATPYDDGNRGCAEWCFRTHFIKINNTNTFEHYMGPLDCASNPVSNQGSGNWTGDRAGWCPGMEVPTRIDTFETSMAGSTIDFQYDFQDWTNDDKNGKAYNAISTYVVVKSNSPIEKAIVQD